MRKQSRPVGVRSALMHGEQKWEHPAFGSIVVTQMHGSSRLFGSAIRHSSVIRLQICEASAMGVSPEVSHVQSGAVIVDVELSASQFVRALTSIGNGSGTQCTIRRRATGSGVSVDEIADPEQSAISDHADGMRHSMQAEMARINAAADRLEASLMPGAKPLGKKELAELVKDLRVGSHNLPSNAEYALTKFGRFAEQQVQEAKAAVEAHVDLVARSIGYKAMADAAAAGAIPDVRLDQIEASK